jgi:hypothetical protein
MSVRSVDALRDVLSSALRFADIRITTRGLWLDRAGFVRCTVFEISICGDLR